MPKENGKLRSTICYMRGGSSVLGNLAPCHYFTRQRMAVLGRKLKALCPAEAVVSDHVESAYVLWLHRNGLEAYVRRADWLHILAFILSLLEDIERSLDPSKPPEFRLLILRRLWLITHHMHICRVSGNNNQFFTS